MVRMNDFSKKFLEKYLPELDISKATHVNDILDPLGDLIDRQGFAPPDYYDYNDLGREAQKVYDDIYLCAEEDKEAEAGNGT